MTEYEELRKLAQMADERGDKETALAALRKMESMGPQGDQAKDATITDRIGQAAGSVNEGAVRLAGIPGDLANNIHNLFRMGYGTAVTAAGRPDLAPDVIPASEAPLTGEWLANRMGKAGVFGTRTGDTTEKYIRSAGEFAGMSLLGPASGVPMRMAAGAASGLSSEAAGQAFPDQPIARLAGALAPTALALGATSGLRGALRGTPESAKQMQANIAQQELSGMPADAALARGGRLAGALKYMSRAPGGVGVGAKKGKEIQAAMGESLSKSAPSATDPVFVGSEIKSSISDFSKKASASWSRINDKMVASVPRGTNVNLVDLKSKLDDISGSIPADYKDALSLPAQLKSLSESVAKRGTLTWKEADQIRRALGQKASDASLISDVSKGQWKALYGAVSNDMRASLPQGSRAEQLFNRSHKHWQSVINRTDNLYQPLANAGTPEAAYRASVSSMNKGATQIEAIRKVMPKDAFAKLRDTFLEDMGKAKAGRQSDTGELFSSETFLTNWNTMNSRAKNALVGQNSQLRADLDRLAKNANSIRQIEATYANPSGTALAAGSIATGGMVFAGLLSGNIALVGSVLGAMGINFASARTITNPKFAHFLAEITTVKPDRAPAIAARFMESVNKDNKLREELGINGNQVQQ